MHHEKSYYKYKSHMYNIFKTRSHIKIKVSTFRNITILNPDLSSETYLEPRRISTIGLFCENS